MLFQFAALLPLLLACSGASPSRSRPRPRCAAPSSPSAEVCRVEGDDPAEVERVGSAMSLGYAPGARLRRGCSSRGASSRTSSAHARSVEVTMLGATGPAASARPPRMDHGRRDRGRRTRASSSRQLRTADDAEAQLVEQVPWPTCASRPASSAAELRSVLPANVRYRRPGDRARADPGRRRRLYRTVWTRWNAGRASGSRYAVLTRPLDAGEPGSSSTCSRSCRLEAALARSAPGRPASSAGPAGWLPGLPRPRPPAPDRPTSTWSCARR